ncbi:MAG: PTS sugar transporter subunit IIB [Solobacterium sp.]|nr:PTS sugar transporter subunit IIB [Solobacterium sp.]
MIIQLRLDERLIHGQIVTAWSKALQIGTILVANDAAAADPMRTKLLLMTAPPGMKVFVKPVKEAIKLVSDPRADKMRILMIVNNPKDMLEIIRNAPNIEAVNVANYVHKKSSGKVVISQYTQADPEDLEIFKQIAEAHNNVFTQLIPSYARSEFKTLLANAKPLSE